MKRTGILAAASAAALMLGMLGGCSNENAQELADTAESVAQEVSDAATTDESLMAILNAANAYLKDLNLDDYVTTGDYKNLAVEVTERSTVTDEEVEKYIESVASTLPATKEITDRSVQSGDTVNIDYKGKLKETGEYFEKGSAEAFDLLIGSGTFIPGFEDGLIGANVGEERDLELTFPEGYRDENVAGKEVIFETKVNAIKVKPDIDDEYVRNLGLEGVNNLAQFKEYLGNRIQERYDEVYESNVKETVTEKVVDEATVKDVPQEMIDRYVAQFTQQAKLMAEVYSATYGYTVTYEDYINSLMQQNGFSGTVDEYLKERADMTAKRYMVLVDIAQKEGITVSDSEVEKSIQEDLAGSSQPYESEEELLQALGVTREGYREELLGSRVVEYLVEKANVTDKAQ